MRNTLLEATRTAHLKNFGGGNTSIEFCRREGVAPDMVALCKVPSGPVLSVRSKCGQILGKERLDVDSPSAPGKGGSGLFY
ncbi:hypothetical protein [Rhodococcus sp. MS16]|uniref:hypothetical protein n=1 Tax=Rhodococcus sp. MS16 TaxID=2579941 RepID=UPI001561AF13|nr:hypothetical protein [Rhodococcus sp. MS16]